MRLFTILVLLVAVVVALGLYRGWFHVASDNSAVTVTVDKDKIQQDKTEAQTKVEAVKQK